MSGDLRSSYAGEFDPEFSLADLSRQALCHLGREYLLIGHLQDRVGLPLATIRFGEEAQRQFSIDEWMGASPIYSKRMQKALGFEGNTVDTTFKNLQIEIGAPPQFMDFQFRLDNPEYGEFWLPHCGALLDVEPFGEERVKAMCHDIEDPTFDATAAATNPRMRMRPIHRPPRRPADRYPHCRWAVFIDGEAVAYEQHRNLATMQATKIASIPIVLPTEIREVGGWTDYSGPFDPGFQLEDLGHQALLVVAQEATVQAHLLARAFMLNVAQLGGDEVAIELGRRQWTGTAALATARLRKALEIEGDGIDAIAKIFQIHPHFHPRSYLDLRVEILDERRARVSVGDCPAFEEGDAYSWLSGLGPDPHPALDAIAGAINPHARCHPVAEGSLPAEGSPRAEGSLPAEGSDARFAWDIVIDPDAPPQQEPDEMKFARFTRGATFELEQRRPLRGVE